MQLVKYGRNGSRQHMASGHRDTQGDTQADEADSARVRDGIVNTGCKAKNA